MDTARDVDLKRYAMAIYDSLEEYGPREIIRAQKRCVNLPTGDTVWERMSVVVHRKGTEKYHEMNVRRQLNRAGQCVDPAVHLCDAAHERVATPSGATAHAALVWLDVDVRANPHVWKFFESQGCFYCRETPFLHTVSNRPACVIH